jgi:AraC family transcriptional regulator
LTRHGADLPAKRLRARPLPLTSFRRVADYVDANLGSSFELGDMAVLARLSEHHFLRSFSLATGMTPHQFVLGKRIERAEELLRRTRLPLTRIALDTGFASHSHMSRTFRSKTGRTPTAYRLTASD